MNDPVPLCYPVKKVAQLLGISKSLAYELVESKELKSIRIRTKILVRSSDLMEYVESLAEAGL